MAKVAHHHHPMRMSPGMIKAQDWAAKIGLVAAVIGGLVVLFSALTSHGSVNW